MPTLSKDEARRAFLAAQGLASRARRSATATWPRMAKAIERINLLQIDSVNVLERSHYLPVFARCGHYSHANLNARCGAGKKRRMFEYWAHEASLLPLKLHPLLRWRMRRAANHKGIYKDLVRFAVERREYVETVRGFIAANGPSVVSDLPDPGRRTPDWWSWSDGKMAMELLFWTGEVTTAHRRGNFERVYDLTERVLPAKTLNAPTPEEPDAIRELLRLSARALAVATETDLRDYFRLPVAQTRTALGELVESGDVKPVTVDGWDRPGFMFCGADIPARATASALLSPFDPVVWERQRTERMFGFRYRIEIYTPRPKRVYGYYVLPFLHRGRLAGRVCLKSDRHARVLRINAAHIEPGFRADETAAALGQHLAAMARWLGLDGLDAGDHGNLASQLKAACDRV